VRAGDDPLKSLEIIAGLLLAAILFILLELVGMVVKFALIAAALGFVAGLLLARSLRR
jgi:membrane associated rhomboid family serine protease